jgi:hypothetical protein
VLAIDPAQRAAADQFQSGIGFEHGGGHQIVFLRVMAQLHEAQLPSAPHLVAHAPVLHPVRFRMAVLRPPSAANRFRRAVGVFDLLAAE